VIAHSFGALERKKRSRTSSARSVPTAARNFNVDDQNRILSRDRLFSEVRRSLTFTYVSTVSLNRFPRLAQARFPDFD
jgi:hypothetical protein